MFFIIIGYKINLILKIFRKKIINGLFFVRTITYHCDEENT